MWLSKITIMDDEKFMFSTTIGAEENVVYVWLSAHLKEFDEYDDVLSIMTDDGFTDVMEHSFISPEVHEALEAYVLSQPANLCNPQEAKRIIDTFSKNGVL